VKKRDPKVADLALHKEAAKAAAVHAFKTQAWAFASSMFAKVEARGATREELRELLRTVNKDVGLTVRAIAEHGINPALGTRMALNATMLATITDVAMSDAPGYGAPELRANLETRFSEELDKLEPLA
jgi:hypothetical protein